MRKFILAISTLTFALTGCSLSPIVYTPEQGQAVAHLNYEIDKASYQDFNNRSKQGLVERVSVSFSPQKKLIRPNDVKTLLMEFYDGTRAREGNQVPASTPLLLYYSHQQVDGSLRSHWPKNCETKLAITFEPNKSYLYKGSTITEPNHRKVDVHDIKCRIQIIDKESGTVIADSGYGNTPNH